MPRFQGKGVIVVKRSRRGDVEAQQLGIEIVQRRLVGLAVGGHAFDAIVDEHLLEGAHGLGGILAIGAVGSAEEVTQGDEAALGTAHVAVFIALFEGIVGIGHAIVVDERLRVFIGDAVAAQVIALCAEEFLEICNRFDGFWAVIAVWLDAQKPQVVEALLQALYFVALGPGSQFLRAGIAKEQ